MIHEGRVVGNVPVDAICIRILNMFILGLSPILKPTRSILIHAEKKDVTRGAITLTTDAEVVGVPSLRPILCISIDMVEEEMVQQPDMRRDLGVEAMMDLEVGEELLPLLTEAMCDIVPEALDTGVVNAPL
jgi:hypothetical protein